MQSTQKKSLVKQKLALAIERLNIPALIVNDIVTITALELL